MSMKVEGMTPDREQYLIRNSKWYGRVFKTREQCIETWPEADLTTAPRMRAPLYPSWLESKGSRNFANLLNRVTAEGSDISVGHLVGYWGKEGESYQDAFDACFCEEIFVPLDKEGWLAVTDETIFQVGVEYEITWWPTIEEIGPNGYTRTPYEWDRGRIGFQSERQFVTTRPTFYRLPKEGTSEPDNSSKYLLGGWIPWADKKKPYDGATCDLCYSQEEIDNLEWQTAEYRQWISHPGGEATANAGPGFVDEHGFPAYEEPVWWRYTIEEPELIVGTKGPVEDLEDLKGLFYDPRSYPRAPDECFPPSSSLTPSEDDDYYATI